MADYEKACEAIKYEAEDLPFFIDCLMIRNRILFARKYMFPEFQVKVGLFLSLAIRVFRLQPLRAIKILQILASEESFRKFIQKNGGFYA